MKIDTEALSRVAASLSDSLARLEADIAQVGRGDYAAGEFRRKLTELADEMEGEYTYGYCARLREILEEEESMADHSSTSKEKTERRMEDVNRSTRPGDRNLVDLQREQGKR